MSGSRRFVLAILAVATACASPRGRDESGALPASIPLATARIDSSLRLALPGLEAKLPRTSRESLSIRDPRSGVALEVRARGLSEVASELRDGRLIMRDPSGALAIHVPRADGVEDLRVLPDNRLRELRFDLALGDRAAGLRLVDDVLEVLDESGAPRLRANRPWVSDRNAVKHSATFAIEGCALDRDPRAPWGRPVVSPGNTSCALVVSWAGELAAPLVVDPMWTATGNMTVARTGGSAAVALDATRALVCGDGTACDLFDLTTKTFATTAPAPASMGTGGAVLLTTGKVLGVFGGVYTSSVYDPAAGTWTATGNVITPRRTFTLTALGLGRALITGGTTADSATILSTTELWSGGTWTASGSMTVARTDHQAVLLPGRVVIVGGRAPSGPLSSVEVWSNASGTSAAVRPMSAPRFAHRVVLSKVNRVVAIAGLVDTGVFQSKVEVWDPDTDTWNEGPALDLGRRGPYGFTLNDGRILLTGGGVAPDGSATADVRVLDSFGPRGAWIPIEPLGASRQRPLAVAFPNDNVLVAGGSVSVGMGAPSTPVATAELLTLLPNASACTDSVSCASGFCVDGVCCATACDGVCQACSAATKVSGADGVCGNAKTGSDPHDTCKDDGSPACGLDGTCDGAGACKRYAGTGCAPNACTRNADCASGACADGICCNVACGTACRACTRALKGFGVDGVCEDVPAGVDPKNRCAADPGYPESCLADGQCDGAGACRRFAVTGTSCGTVACSGTKAQTPACNGSGACISADVECGTLACTAGVGCAKSCAGDTDCASTAYCEAGTCTAKKSNGATAVDPRTCASGNLADGVCCNAPCAGTCEACDVMGSVGSCVAVAGAPRHGVCPDGAGDPCAAATCDGITRATCAAFAGTDVLCRPASCDLGIATLASRCDGSGKCPAPMTKTCAPFACVAGECKTACAADGDCAEGSKCDPATKLCSTPARCDGASTVVAATGTRTDCQPYRCREGACLEKCANSAECAVGFVCDSASSTCIAPTAPTADEGGCTTSHAGARGAWSLWALALVAAVIARRRSLLLALSVVSCSSRTETPSNTASEARSVLSIAGLATTAKASPIALPRRANEPLTVRDASGMTMTVSAVGVAPVEGVRDGELSIHDNAYGPGTALVRRPLEDGAEDLARVGANVRSLRWTLTLGPGVAGLRLVGDVLELVDERGVPRLRGSAPFIVDAERHRFAGALDVEGCAVDRDASDPRDRAPTPPGAARCTVVVAIPDAARAPRWVDPLWTTTASLTRPRLGQRSALDEITRRVFVTGGNETPSSEIFDPATNTWAAGPAVNVNLGFGLIAATGGGMIVTGGSIGPSAAYLVSGGSITTLPSLTAPRRDHVMVRATDGTVYAVGGSVGTTADSWNAGATTWTSSALPVSIFGNGATTKLLGSGTSAGKTLIVAAGSALIFDPGAKTFATAASTLPRQFGRLAPLPDGRAMLIGGIQPPSNYLSTTEIFDPASGTWSASAPLAYRRNNTAAIALRSGLVLVVGGGAPVALTSAEAFNPATGTWTTAGELGEGRLGMSLEQLDDGRVLAVGGGYNTKTYLFAQGAIAAACTADIDCLGGHCIEGVCCDTACTGTCQSCLAINKVSGADGTCGPVKAGLDPRNACKDDGSPACTKNGLCDGMGACQSYAKTVDCRPRPCVEDTDCTSGFCADGICCDKKCDGPCESCAARDKKSGVDGVCGVAPAGTDPRGRCAPDKGFPTSCKADGFCDGAGACRTFAPKGTPCGASSCTSGTAAGPLCDGTGTCNATTLACAPYLCKDATACATSCVADADCATNAFCAAGTCVTKKANGESAFTARECVSGVVADGVCCSAACDGTCEACDAAGSKGACVAVTGPARHGSCGGSTSDPCAAPRCDGADRKSCKGLPGSEVVCRTGFCGDGVERSTSRCDGKGSCVASTVKACAPYACSDGACAVSCDKTEQCATGYTCDVASKTCVSGDVCDGDHTVKSPSGDRDCTPFKCAGSACLTQCSDSTSCVAGQICDVELKQCVTPAPAAAEDEGGCALGGTSRHNAWFAVALTALLATRRRRR